MERVNLELEDVILHLLKSQPKVVKDRQFISYDRYLGEHRLAHNYQRDKALWQNMYKLYYKGIALGIIQRRPYKQVVIFNQPPELREVQREFENVLDSKLPIAERSYRDNKRPLQRNGWAA